MPRKQAAPDPVVTPEELSAELKVPLSTVYQWNYKGTGPEPFRPGGRQLRWRRSVINKWLEECGDKTLADEAAATGLPAPRR
jgi:predicted DNA-binding transcriptional regulator AlpA